MTGDLHPFISMLIRTLQGGSAPWTETHFSTKNSSFKLSLVSGSCRHQDAAALSQCPGLQSLAIQHVSLFHLYLFLGHLLVEDDAFCSGMKPQPAHSYVGFPSTSEGAARGKKRDFVIICPLHRGLHHCVNVRLRDKKEEEGGKKGAFNSYSSS